MTISIAARCATTGAFGMAISSSSPAVAARCAHARAGVGVAASQNVTHPGLGHRMLDLMGLGLTAPDAVAQAAKSHENRDFRQLTAVDAEGRTGHFTGARALGRHAVAEGAGCVAAGNLLADTGVPAAMVAAFTASDGHLAARLIRALEGGIEAGGEEGPVHSAGVLVVHEVAWPLVDLRVDWHDSDPIGALRALWALYEPQMIDYLNRAIAPTQAPSYGVPGDL
ncbi:MAG: DUF1028 domain-containing protein [Rhizobiales bacterium]|nr:DUF1028 domain-containing protein [Hyphomicrobiales bacterium]